MKDSYIITKYYSDVGSIKIGNKEFNIDVHNGYGDGEHQVTIVKHKITKEFPELYNLKNDYRFVTTMDGNNYNIYNYDSLKTEELDDPRYIITTLNGKFAIYINYGDVLIESWDKEISKKW